MLFDNQSVWIRITSDFICVFRWNSSDQSAQQNSFVRALAAHSLRRVLIQACRELAGSDERNPVFGVCENKAFTFAPICYSLIMSIIS